MGDADHTQQPRPATPSRGRYDAPGWQPGQKVLNTHWPAHPATFEHKSPGLPVTAHIIWADDGEQYVEGQATRWDSGHVYVEFNDRRLETSGVWLKPADVYRRSPVPPKRDRPPRLQRVDDAMRGDGSHPDGSHQDERRAR